MASWWYPVLMRVAAEPFITREAVLSILRPGELMSERPFRTLRQHGAASPGFSVMLRSPGGHILGRLQLYSNLNGDAARAFRLHDPRLAQALAGRAQEIERSSAARRVRAAVAAVAAQMPAPSIGVSPSGLRRYADLRRRFGGRGLDAVAMAREWLAGSDAWLGEADDRDELVDAIAELDRAAAEARADLIGEGPASVSTFYGVVRRMDASSAEVEGATESLLVPREDLERQGLAAIDQPVALLREALPGGGSYLLPMSAVRLDEGDRTIEPSPWDLDDLMDGVVPTSPLSEADEAWLRRDLAREPSAVPIAPLRLA
jgi:hypothetical protein